jgi:hypothetical protein
MHIAITQAPTPISNITHADEIRGRGVVCVKPAYSHKPQLSWELHRALARERMLLVFIIPLCMLAEQNLHRRGCHHIILKVETITARATW